MSSKTYHEKLQHWCSFVQLIHCDGECTPWIEPIKEKLTGNMNFSNLVIMSQKLNIKSKPSKNIFEWHSIICH